MATTKLVGDKMVVETTRSYSSDAQEVHNEASNDGVMCKAVGALPTEIRLLSMISIFLFPHLLRRITLL